MLPHQSEPRKHCGHSGTKGLRVSSFRLIAARRSAPDEPAEQGAYRHDPDEEAYRLRHSPCRPRGPGKIRWPVTIREQATHRKALGVTPLSNRRKAWTG